MDCDLKSHFFLAFAIKYMSISTTATMASATGTARGHRHGSCLPDTAIFACFPLLSTVCCSFEIDDAGFIAMRQIMSSPLLIPPDIPPELLVENFTFPLEICIA